MDQFEQTANQLVIQTLTIGRYDQSHISTRLQPLSQQNTQHNYFPHFV